MTILYDVTRLVCRRNAETPTGIDRVDLRYIEEYMKNFPNDIQYVYQQNGCLVLLNKKQFEKTIHLLSKKWRGESTSSSVIDVKIPGTPWKKTQSVNTYSISSVNPFKLFLSTYRTNYRRVRESRPNRALKGKVKWINSLPLSIKIPLLTASGFVYGTFTASRQIIGGIKNRKPSNSPRHLYRNKIDSEYISPDLQKLLKHSSVYGGKNEYINVSHHGIDNESLYADLYTAYKVRFTFFVHDLIPVDFPEYVRPGDDVKHSDRMICVLRYASTIVVNSEYTRDRLRTFASMHNLKDPNDIILTRTIGVEEHLLGRSVTSEESHFERPYFVVLGTIEPRKNHLLLFNVWRAMVDEIGEENAPLLVVVGKRGWENQNIVAMLDRCSSIKSSIVELSGISDGKLKSLIMNSRALLFPSFVEGWGMPLVEAMAMGVPIICSDIPVFHEAGQELALYLDPLDGKSWKKMIVEFSKTNSTYRVRQISKQARFVTPRWDNHFIESSPISAKFVKDKLAA